MRKYLCNLLGVDWRSKRCHGKWASKICSCRQETEEIWSESCWREGDFRTVGFHILALAFRQLSNTNRRRGIGAYFGISADAFMAASCPDANGTFWHRTCLRCTNSPMCYSPCSDRRLRVYVQSTFGWKYAVSCLMSADSLREATSGFADPLQLSLKLKVGV